MFVYPDGRTGTIYKKDSLITSLTTDKNGEASVSDLYLGKYYLKELSAPVGYVLDPTEHDVDCTYEGATVPTVERTSVCKETVIKQPFQIIKAANNGKTDADLLQGVGFSAWLVSDLKVKADGSYDFDSARPVVLTADGQTEMFTDEIGFVYRWLRIRCCLFHIFLVIQVVYLELSICQEYRFLCFCILFDNL